LTMERMRETSRVARSRLARRSLLRHGAILGVTGAALMSGLRRPVLAQDATPTGDANLAPPQPVNIGGRLTIASYGATGPLGDALEEYWFTPLREDYGIDLNVVSPVDYGKIEAMVRTGNIEWDLIDSDGLFMARAKLDGLGEPIDYSIVDTTNLVEGAALEYGVVINKGAVTISYPTDALYAAGQGPETWEEFYDANAFPGRRAFHSTAYETLPTAALADGVPMDQLYPLDLDRAFKSLDRIRPQVVKFYDTGVQSQELVNAKEVDLISAWSGRMGALVVEGKPVYFTFNQGIPFDSGWVVVKGSPNKDQAMHAINVLANTPMLHKVLAEITTYGFTNKLGMEMVDPALLPLLSTAPDNVQIQAPLNDEWWAENQQEVVKRMQEWLIS
jgi:putative spermidine/putrescine transport system substrate-binding protein